MYLAVIDADLVLFLILVPYLLYNGCQAGGASEQVDLPSHFYVVLGNIT